MSEEQLKEAIQYNLDYLEGNIDFELEYKELAESYSKLYEELEAKSKMLVNRDKELITFSDEIDRLNNIINKAVDYIEYMQNISKNKNIYVSVYDLVKLLKGEDKE